MLTHGANINARNANGNTPLHFACLTNSEKTVMWLVRHSADIGICNV